MKRARSLMLEKDLPKTIAITDKTTNQQQSSILKSSFLIDISVDITSVTSMAKPTRAAWATLVSLTALPNKVRV